MQVTYTENILYNITMCPKKDSPNLYDPLKKSEIAKIRKQYPGKLEAAMEKLSDKNLFRADGMSLSDYKSCLAECFMKSAICAKIKYNISGYVHLSVTFDQTLSDTEKRELLDNIDAQLTDGYGENPFKLFDIGRKSYWLTF